VAKVTSKGKVTGIKAGKATVTVKEVLKKGKKKKRTFDVTFATCLLLLVKE